MNARRYALSAAATLALLLGGTVAFTAAVDPYLLRRPPGDAVVGVSRVIRQDQVSKPLRAVRHDPDVLLLGSSRTLLGFDPSRVDAGRAGTVYNLGISGVQMDQAADVLDFVLAWADPHTVVLEVYPTAVGRTRSTPRHGSAPDSVDRLVTWLGTAFLSGPALKDTWRAATGTGDPLRPTVHADGFAATRPFTAGRVARRFNGTRDRGDYTLDRAKLAAVDRIAARCAERGIDLVLFVPPVHARYAALFARHDGGADVAAVDAELRRVARTRGLPLWDFTDLPGVTDRPMTATTPAFIDLSHMTPLLGGEVLRRMGVPQRVERPAVAAGWPDGRAFGRRGAVTRTANVGGATAR